MAESFRAAPSLLLDFQKSYLFKDEVMDLLGESGTLNFDLTDWTTGLEPSWSSWRTVRALSNDWRAA